MDGNSLATSCLVHLIARLEAINQRHIGWKFCMLYLERNIGADVHWRKIRLAVGGRSSCRHTSNTQRCIEIRAEPREGVEDLDGTPPTPPDVLDLKTCGFGRTQGQVEIN